MPGTLLSALTRLIDLALLFSDLTSYPPSDAVLWPPPWPWAGCILLWTHLWPRHLFPSSSLTLHHPHYPPCWSSNKRKRFWSHQYHHLLSAWITFSPDILLCPFLFTYISVHLWPHQRGLSWSSSLSWYPSSSPPPRHCPVTLLSWLLWFFFFF